MWGYKDPQIFNLKHQPLLQTSICRKMKIGFMDIEMWSMNHLLVSKDRVSPFINFDDK